MHTLVDMLNISRKEFSRNLKGLTDPDARKRIEPMNCMSWIIAHVANQYHTFFVEWAQGKERDERYLPYGFGSPASQPPLEEAMTLWNDACRDADVWLKTATEEDMKALPVTASPESENMGALTARCIFHTWCHLGEISSIRQILGHKPPQFVNMYDWLYTGK
jgi:hypothetical protein